MREIKKLDKEHLRDALGIAVKSYPMMGIDTAKKQEELEQRILEGFDQDVREWYGLFEDGKLLGNMVLYDFITNYYGQELKARGVGFVAVDFLHKKQKICKDMISWYLADSIEKNYPLAVLYSFRPDFYHKMGFGFGTFCHNYLTHPERLPRWEKAGSMRYLSTDDKETVVAFYHTLYSQNHGMMPKRDKEIDLLLKAEGFSIVGYEENGILSSILIFVLSSNDSTNQSTHMKVELLFTTSTGLKAALNFLNSQADQVSEIAISTPFPSFFFNLDDIRHLDHKILKDPGFHHIFDAGMGMMYRSLNHAELLLKRPSTMDKISIRFILSDSFVDSHPKDFIISWKEGKAEISETKHYDLILKMDVADYASWIMNSIDIVTLYSYGRVEISDESKLHELDRGFYFQQKPICLQRF